MINKVINKALSLYYEIDWIIIVNKEGVIEYSTLYDSKLKEFKDEHTSGMHVLEVYPELKLEDSSIMRVLRTGKPILYERQLLKDFMGNEVNILNSTVPIIENGVVIGAIEVSKFVDDFFKENKGDSIVKYTLEDIITKNSVMNEIKKRIVDISKTNSSVIITGETGTGKELVAQSIHNHSIRSTFNFVTANCAAIPESLFESILFGTAKGAYTGSIDSKGLIQKADKGTLFLDEIHMMPLNVQAKLLRFLEDHVVRKVGSTEEIKIDVRIISAMNIDMIEAVKKKIIRKDLFYRLSVVSIKLPPLRERREDIELLTNHFIDKYNYSMHSSVQGISQLTADLFLEYNWRGNIRELRHVIEGAFNYINEGKISLEHLPEYMINVNKCFDISFENDDVNGETLSNKMYNYEKKLIKVALSESNSYSEAAAKLGITRQSLRYKMEKFKLN